MKGYIVSIYKNPAYAGCANGGISETNDRAMWVGEGAPEIFDAPELPRVLLVQGNVAGQAIVRPCDDNGISLGRGMMGGAYVSTSDGRWCDALEAITGNRAYGAVALHDRFEA